MKPVEDYSQAELDRDIAICFPLMASDIQWEPGPAYQLERLDLLGLTPDEIVHVAFLMQSVLRDMRELLHVAVAQIAAAQKKNDGRKLGQESPASTAQPTKERAAANESNDSR